MNITSFGISLLGVVSAKFFTQIYNGFFLTRGVILALATLIHDIKMARSNKSFIAVIYLDTKGAYASVNPKILTYELASLSIRGKTGCWINTFTHYRRICIHWHLFSSGIASCS